MTCKIIGGAICCDHTTYRNYICFEHTTYLFEFGRFGPAWFTTGNRREEQVDVEPDGNNSFLWEIFEEWNSGRNQNK